MRKPFSLVLVVLVLVPFSLAPFVLSGCGKSDNAVAPEIAMEPSALLDGRVVYALVEPIAFDVLAATLDKNNVAVEEVRVQTDDFTAGFTVNGQPLASVRDRFITEHKKFLETMASMASEKDASAGTNWSPYLVVAHDLKISTITSRTSIPTTLEQLLGVSVVDEDSDMEDPSMSRSPSDSEAPDSYWHESWAPCSGWSRVLTGFSYQEFRFNSVSSFQSGSRTYEHETHVWEESFVRYADYWASNMPYAYLDTGIGDDEETYTIGCARAELLRVGPTYWTYMAFQPQGSPSSLCKIKGQIGHRVYPTCYSTWCIFADATTYPHLAYIQLPCSGVNWTY